MPMKSTDTFAPESVVIVGAGPAGRAAASVLSAARIVARPDATAWHAEPGRIWIETASGVQCLPFARLLLCADEPLLLLALGCAFAGGWPVVGTKGETSVPGIFAAGRILGATTPEEAARQGRIAACGLAGLAVEGGIDPPPPMPEAPGTERLDPLDIAQLLERPPGPERNRAALAQARARGPRLHGVVAPARPVGLAALAALAPAALAPRDAQQDAATLGTGGHGPEVSR